MNQYEINDLRGEMIIFKKDEPGGIIGIDTDGDVYYRERWPEWKAVGIKSSAPVALRVCQVFQLRLLI